MKNQNYLDEENTFVHDRAAFISYKITIATTRSSCIVSETMFLRNQTLLFFILRKIVSYDQS